MPRDWAPLQANLVEPPRLDNRRRKNVEAMLSFSQKESNSKKMNFNNSVTNANMRLILGYDIPEATIPFAKERKGKVPKPRDGP